ncbi:hypothetical protein FKW77_001115 [Venturia effusa]|uniref:Uncharacterized protein n=1 Tax=Venturia effusa TaxID=50376 RepID=A0A517L6P0_9PEZI|nr:hypothetical protein FKW77_001115 [Venturia effusa]
MHAKHRTGAPRDVPNRRCSSVERGILRDEVAMIRALPSIKQTQGDSGPDGSGLMKAGAAHVAFSAPSRAAVRNFYANALRAGGTPHGPPAAREDGENLFNAAVLDCDGNSVEVVFHEDAAFNDGASHSGQSRVLTLHQDHGDNKSIVSTKSAATAVKTAPVPAGSLVPKKVPSIANSVTSKSSSKTIEMPTAIKRSFTAPALTPKSSDDTISISRKTLVGTILGAAAGAAVAYAMCKSEEDSAKKEQNFLAQLQSQQAAQQIPRPKLVKQVSDPQPVYSSSPRSIQTVPEAESYFNEYMQPRQIEPAPASYHHPSYTTVFTNHQQANEKMSTAGRSRVSFGRTMPMPEEQRSQASSRAQTGLISNFELDERSQVAPSRAPQSTLIGTFVPEPSEHRSSASNTPSERRSSHSSSRSQAAKSQVSKAPSEHKSTTSSSKHSGSSGRKHRGKSRRGSEVLASRSPSPVLEEVPESRRATPSSRSSVLGRSVIDHQSEAPYPSSSELDTGNDTDTVVPSDSISCVGSSRRSHRASSQLSQQHSVNASPPQQQQPLQFSARTPSHSSKRDNSRRASEAASLPPSPSTLSHMSRPKSKRASSDVSGGSKHSSKSRSSPKKRRDSKDVKVTRPDLIEEADSDEDEDEASTMTPGKYSNPNHIRRAMSFDPGGLRSASPALSEHARASPSSRRLRDEGALPKDKHYRRYALGVERALSTFDTAQQEWADYISFLSRLLKALQAHPSQCHTVPDSQTVALRLSQCLNHQLPSGVHQKALEVYAYVFTIIGSENLAKHLHLYLPGLSSVLSFAALSVRPYFLSLLEDHVLHIGPSALRPAIKSIILTLLPGLEDETSEDFERVVQVLDKFRTVSEEKLNNTQGDKEGDTRDSYFWQCFFLATITSPSRRQGALAFLARYLPKFATHGSADQALQSLPMASQAALSPEPGLLIRCFAAGLLDPQLLVQRGFLDLLVTHLPLNSAVLQQAVPQADLDRIVFAAAGVVSRRDMSLNRRLWAWFLGPEPKGDVEKAEDNASSGVKSPTVDLSSHHAAYFGQFGLQSLTRSILSLLHRKEGSPAERARPFRICLSLMDRWEVGGLLIPDLFIPAMRNVFEYSQSASKSDVDDVVKSASIFFDGVESGLIWAKIFQLLETSLRPSKESETNCTSNLQLCLFILQRFNLREEEMLVHHMPLTLLAALVLLNERDAGSSSRCRSARVEHLALDVVERLANITPERAFAPDHSEGNSGRSLSTSREVLAFISRFYTEHQGTLDGELRPLSSAVVCQTLLRQTLALFLSSFGRSHAFADTETTARVLCNLLQKVPGVTPMLREVDLQSTLQNSLAIDTSKQMNPIEFPTVSAVTMLLATTQSITTEEPYMATPDFLKIQHGLVRLLWIHLSSGNPKYHVEAVRCLWQLEAISPSSRYIEASITDLLSLSLRATTRGQPVSRIDSACRFMVLWNHSMQEKAGHGGEKGQRAMIKRKSSSTGLNTAAGFPTDPSSILARPLFVLLDCLAEEGTELFDYVKAWIRELPTLPRVFDILIAQIQSLQCFQTPAKSRPRPRAKSSVTILDDSEHCLYYLRMLLRIVKYASEHTWKVVAYEKVDPLSSQETQEPDQVALQILLVEICMKALHIASSPKSSTGPHSGDLERTSLEILLLLTQGPFSALLKELELEKPLLDRLQTRLPAMEPLVQTSLLSTITEALKLRLYSVPQSKNHPTPRMSRDAAPSASSTSIPEKPASSRIITSDSLAPPPSLIECLKAGFSLPSSRMVLDNWVTFLVDVLPLFPEAIFQNLIPLVECFCTQIGMVFEHLKSTFISDQTAISSIISPEPTLISLMTGLEQILAQAHSRLLTEELNASNTKSPDQPQGFFGNMVQGVFASDAEKPLRTSTANNRLAVLLCFQDTVRSCFTIWSWGLYGHGNEKQDATSVASFGYTSLRMRNRARRLLERLFEVEALESLETLAVFFCRPPSVDFQTSSVMGLLNALHVSRPRHTIPAIFNSIYSRTNPTALNPGKISSLTSELSDTELVGFLVEYVKSIEDDAMDEIWADCMAFTKDVLANPLPHSQILPLLLEFVALIAEKVDNTNFGDQRRMRKELGDVFLRMLTATFTTRPMGFLQEPAQPGLTKDRSAMNGASNRSAGPRNFVSILASVVTRLQLILVDNERISTAVTSISTSVTGPTIRAKAFPSNVDGNFLDLLYQLTKLPQGSKAWKKDVADALNDTRFFTMPIELVGAQWTQILRQLSIADKDRMPDLLSRITAPTTAGIVFGVGATSARMEADRKTQLNLRRIALLILSSDEDTFVPDIRGLEEKIVELLTATTTSSPSSATRSEIFMVLRALTIKTSSVHLAPLWPIINTELQAAMLSIVPTNRDGVKEDRAREKYGIDSVIQACKVLDTLVTLSPDDFQLHEWLFISDTIDAVYRPSSVAATSLADEIAEALGSVSIDTQSYTTHTGSSGGGMRRPCLDPMLHSLEEEGTILSELPRQVIAAKVLRPFFGQLSIWAFEGVYGMGGVDFEACKRGLLQDLFVDG